MFCKTVQDPDSRNVLSGQYKIGWFKNPVSSQTEKLMAATKFSDYLGLKKYEKGKNIYHLASAYVSA